MIKLPDYKQIVENGIDDPKMVEATETRIIPAGPCQIYKDKRQLTLNLQ